VTVEDMERKGLLLPREEWRDEAPDTQVARAPLVAVFALLAVSAVLMYLGNGNGLTWLGLGLFLLCLAGFTLLSLRAIGSQRD